MARPTKYCEEEVLEKATALFWERGYRRVSIADLVKATGLLAGSLYGRFGNKEGLLLECIHHYARKSSHLFEIAEKAPTPLGRLEALFEEMVKDSTRSQSQWGCFVVNCAMEVAPENEEVARVTSEYRGVSEAWIAETLRAAIAEGELLDTLDVDEMVVSLFGIVYAVRVMSRTQDDPERIAQYKNSVFKALLDPWKTERVA